MPKRSRGRSHSEPPDVSRRGGSFLADTVQVNGWVLLMDPLFLDQLERLLNTVTERVRSAAERPDANQKLLAMITRLVYETIPSDPERVEFRQGRTLGPHRKHWFRAKFGNGRFRLFFRYRTDARIIVYSWVNDSESLRTYGNRMDAYAVFSRMLDSGDPPEDWDSVVRRVASQETLARAREMTSRLQNP